MTGYRMPIFSQGSLLSQDMLEALGEYELRVSENYFAGYTNGIISGAKVHVSQGVIYIGQGLVRYNGRLFFIPENTRVGVHPSNEWQSIRAVFSDMERTKTFENQEMKIELSTRLEHEGNTIEICRIRLQDGARLRCEYRGLADMDTEYDTVNLIDAQWSAYGKESINPEILREFVCEAWKCRLDNPLDISFVMELSGNDGRAVNRELIQHYLENRLEKKDRDYTNREIYQGLCRILKLVKTGASQTTEVRKPRKLLVD
ncbi:MAG: hypothetical protein K2N73_08430 [Lachnospiraceae bacterium]|nr:hypothetical protein [Lachnospiraceae bacterium]